MTSFFAKNHVVREKIFWHLSLVVIGVGVGPMSKKRAATAWANPIQLVFLVFERVLVSQKRASAGQGLRTRYQNRILWPFTKAANIMDCAI